MAEGPLLSVNGNGLSEPPTTIDPEPILQYLTNVLKPLLGTSEEDLTAPDSLLHPSRLPDTLNRCARFAQEAQVAVLYIQKIQTPLSDLLDSDEDVGTNGTSRMSPFLDSHVLVTANLSSCALKMFLHYLFRCHTSALYCMHRNRQTCWSLEPKRLLSLASPLHDSPCRLRSWKFRSKAVFCRV
jgi:hypothetical protein